MAVRRTKNETSSYRDDILLVIGLAILCAYLFQQLFMLKSIDDSSLIAALVPQVVSPLTMIVASIAFSLKGDAIEKILATNRVLAIVLTVFGIVGVALSKLLDIQALFYLGSVIATFFLSAALCFFIFKASRLESKGLTIVCVCAPALACLYLAFQALTGYDDTIPAILSPLVLLLVAWPLLDGQSADESVDKRRLGDLRQNDNQTVNEEIDKSFHNNRDQRDGHKFPSRAILVALVLFALVCALLNSAYILLVPTATIGSNAADPSSRGLMYLTAFMFFVVGIVFCAIRHKARTVESPLRLFLALCVFVVCYIFIALGTGFYLDQRAVMPIISIRTAVEGTMLLTLVVVCRNDSINASQASAILLATIAVSRLLKIVVTCAGKACGITLDGLIVPFALSAAFCIIALIAIAVLSAQRLGTVPQASEIGAMPQPGELSAIPSAPNQVAPLPTAARCLSESAQEVLKSQFALTEREMEVVRCCVERLSTKESADRLFISTSTLYTHQKKIYRKMNVHSKEELLGLISQIS